MGRLLKSPAQREKHGIAPRLEGEERADYERRVPEAFSKRFYWQYHLGGIHEQKSLPVNITTLNQAWVYGTDAAKLMVRKRQAEKKAVELGVVTALEQRNAAVSQGRWCTVGVLLSELEKVLVAEGLQTVDRCCANLRMVIAVAQGWLVPFAGRRMNEALRGKVDALPASVICAATSEAYALACQRAHGAAVETADGWDLNRTRRNPPRVNVVINSNMGQARVPLHGKYRVRSVAALAVPWSVVDTFGGYRLPQPEKDVGEELPTSEAYRAMMEGWEVLRASATAGDVAAAELALCNELLRKLGLRSGELCMARASWLVEVGGRWGLRVCDRPAELFSCKGDAAATLPLEADLAARLIARVNAAKVAGVENPFLILPLLPGGEYDTRKQRNGEHPERAAVVRGAHNRWLKQFIGESPSGQGNHRLRKLCATGLYKSRRAAAEAEGLGKRAAHNRAAEVCKAYLRHESEATTLLHYIAPDMMEDLGEALSDEALSLAW